MPIIDFELFGFRFINGSLDADDPKREQNTNVHVYEEPKPITQAPSPSGLSLGDRLIPKGIGVLEQISYNAESKTISPAIVYSYLFLDSIKPKNFLPYANPRYLVYKQLEFFAPVPYTPGYGIEPDFGYYPAEEQIRYAGQARSGLTVLEQPKPVLAYIWSQSYRHLQAAKTKQYQPAAMFYGANAQIGYQSEQQKFPAARAIHLNAGAKPKALEALVAGAEIRAAHTPRMQIYATQFAYLAHLHGIWARPLPKPDAGLKLDSIVQAYSTPKSPHHEIKTYQNSKSQQSTDNINAAKARSAAATAYAQNFVPYSSYASRNYDMPLLLIRILSNPNSGFWLNPSFYAGFIGKIKDFESKTNSHEAKEESEYRKKEGKLQEENENPVHDDYSIPIQRKIPNVEKKESGEAENTTRHDDARKKNGVQPDDAVNSGSGYNPSSQKARYRTSKMSYAAAIGMGLLGLAALAPMKLMEARKAYAAEAIHLSSATIDNVVAPAAHAPEIKKETDFTHQFKDGMSSLLKQFEQLYDGVGMIIRYNKTGEQFAYSNGKSSDNKKPKPAPSIDKLGIIIAAQYYIQHGLLDPKKPIDFNPISDKDIILEREVSDYPIFNGTKKTFYYNEDLRPLVIRDSVNTATNLVLKFIGEGDIYRGIRRVNHTLEILGIKGVKIEVPYNRIFEYEKNTATEAGAEELARFVLQGEKLKPEYLNPIKEDMENERWMKVFRDMLPGVKSGTKVTIYKRGIGFVAYLDDYSIAFLANDANEQLFSDKATSAKHLGQELYKSGSDAIKGNDAREAEERIVNPIFIESSRKFEEIFKFLGQHLFKITYQQPNTKPA